MCSLTPVSQAGGRRPQARGQHVLSDIQPTAYSLQPRSRRDRRGVLLLVCLSLLVLFAMIAVTFMLVAGQYRRSSRAAGRAEQYGEDYRKQADEVFAQIVRDTTNPNSVLAGHSLLADMYGNDGVRGTFNNVGPAVPGGQFLDITATAITPLPGNTYPTNDQLGAPGFFNGCVLTVTDVGGVTTNLGMRIVGWSYRATPAFNCTIRVMPLDGLDATTTASLTSSSGAFRINGRPFNGTGFGFDTTYTSGLTLLSAKDGNNVPYVFLPNRKYFMANGGYTIFGGIGGPDEDYDAPDPQNMALGYLGIAPSQASHILPSFHRPDLVAYMTATYASAPPRQYILRPLKADHPNFPSIDPINGPWDVDNDGDGVPDSVWVDVGLPVQTAPDGRRYKPLAAILCLDLDGRLNLNAHGSVAQADSNYTQPINPSGGMGTPTIADYLYANGAGGTPMANPHRGSGYGPADINLAALFDRTTLPPTAPQPTPQYATFFKGTAAFEGRYGEYGMQVPRPGITKTGTNWTSGRGGNDDVLASIQRFDYPNKYYNGTVTNFGSPMDAWGRGVVGVDYAGQPIYSFTATPAQLPGAAGSPPALGTDDPDLPNDPYTLNLSRKGVRAASATPTTNDNPFTPAELEAILRQYDLDFSMLPARLQNLGFANPPFDFGRVITTDSYDLPCPSTLPTADVIQTLRQLNGGTVPANVTIVDLLRAKVKQAFPTQPNAVIDNAVNALLRPPMQILAPELVSGLRFDLNRPFGNGVDDDGNGVVDEPTSAEYNVRNEVPPGWNPTATNPVSPFGATSNPTNFDLNNDGTMDPADLLARQQYAKHLYCLMMLLTDQSYNWAQDNGANVSAAQQQEITARRIAQWAINVVDFRDPDSIMTPFEYDVNPFDGWAVDGDISTTNDSADRRVVWGCEQPELLITETLALHDRRVKDTTGDPSGKDRQSAPTPDPDLDQARVPQGSLFIELYCPSNGNASMSTKWSRDLYDNSAAQPRLDLGRMPPGAAGAGQNPVWRIAITGSTLASGGPKNDVKSRVTIHSDTANFDPLPGALAGPARTSLLDPNSPNGGTLEPFDRVIWFTSNDPTGNLDAGKIYYNRSATSTLLNPGRYAVIGSRPTTYLGKNAGTNNAAAQRIDLDTSATGTVSYTPANGSAPNNTPTTKPALPIICRSASLPAGWNPAQFPDNIGVSISEPLFSVGYYSPPSVATNDPQGLNPAGILDGYSAPIDKPFDSAAGAPLKLDAALATGTYLNYKTALLQRLANPLLPFDAVTNPYITVDWSPINLTVFNGEDAQKASPSPFDPDDPGFQSPPATLVATGQERGNNNPNAPPGSDLWNTYSPTFPPTQAPPYTGSTKGGTTAVFEYNLNQSLGYLNKALGNPWNNYTTANTTNYGYINAPDPTVGVQANPFPWLTWNNRPYASAGELLLVPATSAEELLRQFTSVAPNLPSPYDATTTSNFRLPFQHLLNFWMTGDGMPNNATYFYRLFDYVHVPSRFVGTETYLNPLTFNSGTPLSNEATLMSFYHPPFNKVSNYRDPGRVNINTIPCDTAATPSSVVWNGIVNGNVVNDRPGPTWPKIVSSRRGDTNTAVTAPNANIPSYFMNPFRSAGGAMFRLPGAAAAREADVTFMRPDPTAPAQPLLAVTTPTPGELYADPTRHAYFRYQPQQRLSNLLTARSNVYAIWITIGYFEVTPAPTPVNYTIYPDGYQLGQELGSDTGEIERHRAFYIYDRSIPVCFEPGKDHNIDKGVLVKRFIE